MPNVLMITPRYATDRLVGKTTGAIRPPSFTRMVGRLQVLALASALIGSCDLSNAIVADEPVVSSQQTLRLKNQVHFTRPHSSRRSVLAAVMSAVSAHGATPLRTCQAHEEDAPAQQIEVRKGKPFAPLSALLPAARLRVLVDQMYDLSAKLASDINKDSQYQVLQEMNRLWTTRAPLFQSGRPPRTVLPSTAQLTTASSSANKQQYQKNRKDLSLPDRLLAIVNQADVERQWGMLQYQESKREQESELRAALNFYTSQVEFGSAYLLTAPAAERKQMIRNDQLPSLTAVISSDLDLRDLYRNEFLTAMEDAAAELAYQLKQPQPDVQVQDVVELMDQAHAALAKWFDQIATVDVQEAMTYIANE